MKQIIKIFSIVIAISLSAIGYACLPTMIQKWKLGCTFMSITDKKTIPIQSNTANFYSLDSNIQVWDRDNYNTGDVVCVKNKI